MTNVYIADFVVDVAVVVPVFLFCFVLFFFKKKYGCVYTLLQVLFRLLYFATASFYNRSCEVLSSFFPIRTHSSSLLVQKLTVKHLWVLPVSCTFNCFRPVIPRLVQDLVERRPLFISSLN